MSPENDQTKWRGIRPTNPPENIPIAPGAGDPEFYTRTRKRAPAIGDLQAIIDVQVIYEEHTCIGAGDKYRNMYTVGANEFAVMTHMIAQCSTATPTYIFPYLLRGGVYSYLFRWTYTVANVRLFFDKTFVARTDDIFGWRYTAAGNGNILRSNYIGYTVPKF